MTVAAAIVELDARAARLAGEGEAEGAGWAWYRAASLCADHDPGRAAGLLAAADDAIAARRAPRLAGSIALLASELALDRGDAATGAAASVAAERAFQAAGDARGFLAVWVARALRALRGGDPAAGLLMCRWMLPWLDEVAEPAPRLWLRLFAADELRAGDRPVEAIALLAEALDLAAPGSAEHLVVAERLTAAFLAIDRPADAARIAVAAIDGPSPGPAGLRARLYRTLAGSLRATAPGPLAEVCAALAAALDDEEVAAPEPTPAAVAGALLAPQVIGAAPRPPAG